MDAPDIELPRGWRGWLVTNATVKNLVFVTSIVVMLTIYYRDSRNFQDGMEKRVTKLEDQTSLDRESRDTLYRKMDVLQERLDNVSRELTAARDDIRDIRRGQRH